MLPSLGPDLVTVVEAGVSPTGVSAAMGEEKAEAGQTVEDPTEDERPDGDGGLGGVGDEIPHVIARERILQP